MIDTSLERQLANKGLINQNLIELSRLTLLKIILSNRNSDFPYVNIMGDEFENNFTATYSIGTNRQKAKEHIEELIKSANRVEIFDKYLFFDNVGNEDIQDHPSVRLLSRWTNFNISINIYCHLRCSESTEAHRISNRINHFSNIPNIQIHRFPRNSRNNYHDRYIKIYSSENHYPQYEIILSSGIFFLEDNGRDLTYVVRIFP